MGTVTPLPPPTDDALSVAELGPINGRLISIRLQRPDGIIEERGVADEGRPDGVTVTLDRRLRLVGLRIQRPDAVIEERAVADLVFPLPRNLSLHLK